jgi:hypothetical protein
MGTDVQFALVPKSLINLSNSTIPKPSRPLMDYSHHLLWLPTFGVDVVLCLCKFSIGMADSLDVTDALRPVLTERRRTDAKESQRIADAIKAVVFLRSFIRSLTRHLPFHHTIPYIIHA